MSRDWDDHMRILRLNSQRVLMKPRVVQGRNEHNNENLNRLLDGVVCSSIVLVYTKAEQFKTSRSLVSEYIR